MTKNMKNNNDKIRKKNATLSEQLKNPIKKM